MEMAKENSTLNHENLVDFALCFEKVRLATFKDWPFTDDCNCTPLRMAQAGFYHKPTENEPDVACCYLCQKELDGWEPNDDPWKEHQSHSPKCPLLKHKSKKGRLCEDLIMKQFFALEEARKIFIATKQHNAKLKEIQEYAEVVRKEIEAFRK